MKELSYQMLSIWSKSMHIKQSGFVMLYMMAIIWSFWTVWPMTLNRGLHMRASCLSFRVISAKKLSKTMLCKRLQILKRQVCGKKYCVYILNWHASLHQSLWFKLYATPQSKATILWKSTWKSVKSISRQKPALYYVRKLDCIRKLSIITLSF